jgi:hypothetical protein
MLDRVTEFRALGVPVGGGAVLTITKPIADTVGALANRVLGSYVGTAAPAAGQILAAWGVRQPVVERALGPSTSDLVSMVFVGTALDTVLGISATVRGLLAQVGAPAVSAGPAPVASLGQAPSAAAPRVFRSAVARKAALTRL